MSSHSTVLLLHEAQHPLSHQRVPSENTGDGAQNPPDFTGPTTRKTPEVVSVDVPPENEFLASDFERFVRRTRRQPDGCLLWCGAIQTNGYGSFSYGGKGKSVLAHRWIFEAMVGPIPDGLVIDHLCRNRRCVNVAHLEPVTAGENTRRGESPSTINAAKTHCLNGHPLEGDNLILKKNGKRNCRTCQRAHARATYRRANPEVKRTKRSAPLPLAVATPSVDCGLCSLWGRPCATHGRAA